MIKVVLHIVPPANQESPAVESLGDFGTYLNAGRPVFLSHISGAFLLTMGPIKSIKKRPHRISLSPEACDFPTAQQLTPDTQYRKFAMAESKPIDEAFPLDHYLEVMVRFLDAARYQDVNHTQEERRDILHYVYTKTAEHFSSPSLQRTIQAKPSVLQGAINTIVPMVVYCWAKVTIEQMADLSIQFTLCLLLDDSTDDRNASMESFFQDLIENRTQRNAWWRMFNDQFPCLLRHYGPFCSLTLFRNSLDCKLPLPCSILYILSSLLGVTDQKRPETVFQGCWIERHNFQGLNGAHDYPQFLRRLNGLGQFVGASLFPGTPTQEQELVLQITSAMPHLDHWETFCNDAMSFYKEYDCVDDQTMLVRNYVRCGSQASIEEGLDRVIDDVIAQTKILCSVFRDNKDMDPRVAATVEAFCQGYITWHLSEPRYRLRELGERAGDSAAARRFREYLGAGSQAAVDSEHWAYPSVAAMADAQLTNEGATGEKAPRDDSMPGVNDGCPKLQLAFVV